MQEDARKRGSKERKPTYVWKKSVVAMIIMMMM